MNMIRCSSQFQEFQSFKRSAPFQSFKELTPEPRVSEILGPRDSRSLAVLNWSVLFTVKNAPLSL